MQIESANLRDSKILVVDDIPANIELLTMVLESEEFTISFALSGEHAIQLANLDPPDLILLDVMMPGMDGFQTCRALKADEKTRDIPVIFVTAKSEDEDIADAFSAGCVDYINKPIKHEEVIARVNTHLQFRALLKQRDNLINTLQQYNEEVCLLSRSDPLTKLANRRCLHEVLLREWGTAIRTGLPFSTIMVDIDFFKAYNDTYGHQSGDTCLQNIAKLLGDSANRSSDLVARYGGEEFILVLPNTRHSQALTMAQTLCSNVEALEIPHETSSVSNFVTISAGIATCTPKRSTTADALVNAADVALYAAKNAGRNRAMSAATTEIK